MLGNVALYAAKKRKKPVQKVPKAPAPDGTKSNPSKRHRDRLNSELDKLTSLLPFPDDIRARLDKLSVLRLSVGYLKVKSFFNATTKTSPNGSSWPGERSLMFGGNAPTSQPVSAAPNAAVNSSMVASIDGVTFSEGDLLLQALNGFVLVVTAEGYIFYTSPTIQDYLGFHQSDVIHQSVFELIHTDDRSLFKRQLHFALNPNPSSMDSTTGPLSDQSTSEISSNVMTYDPLLIPPENSSFLERSFCCRFRCLLDNSSGFLALNFRGRLKYLHGQNKVSEDGTISHSQLALFAVATLVQPPSILEIRTKTLIFQTKHKLDFSPMAIDTRGKVVLGYSEIELCMKGTGYQFIHAADMMYCADNHLKMIKAGETGFTVFRLLSKGGAWVWVQANARLVFKGGRPDFIVARQRALTNEEGEEHLRLRHLQLPFSFTTGEALLYDVGPTLDVSNPCSAPKQRKVDDLSISPGSLLGCMLSQDQAVYCQHNNTNSLNSLNDVAFKDTHALVNVPGDTGQHQAPSTNNLMKAGGNMQDMMETLQQILGDSELTGGLDVEPTELKDWENILLKMNSGSCGVSEDMDELLSNDILSYVEEQLLKEGGLKIPDQLDDIPVCLSGLDLQSQEPLMGEEQQNFDWTMEPQNQILRNGRQTVTKKQNSVPGIMNLTHMGPPQMGSLGLNGPTLQQIASQSTFSPSVGLHSDISPTGGLSKTATFNPSLMDSCAQTQSQLRNLQPTANQNGHRSCSLRQTSPNQFQSHQMSQSIQNHLAPSVPADLSISLLDQNPSRQFNPSCQNGQWISPIPDLNRTDNFVENYIQNISNQSGFSLEPSSSSFTQCQFPLQTQNVENHRQTWPPQQQQPQHMPTLLSNEHQHVSPHLGQAPGFQLGITQVPENCRPFMPPNTSSTAFPTQQEMEAPPLVPSSSCMFAGSTPSVPVNAVQLNHASQQAPTGPSCQRFNPSNGQSSSESSCYYQGLPSGRSLGGMTVIPHEDSNVQPLSCQMAPGLALDSLLPQQQQQQQQQQQPYINFNEQSQIKNRPIMGNRGFPFSSLPNGNTYYAKNN